MHELQEKGDPVDPNKISYSLAQGNNSSKSPKAPLPLIQIVLVAPFISRLFVYAAALALKPELSSEKKVLTPLEMS